MIVVSCQGCRKKLQITEELAGKKLKCPGCGQVLAVPVRAVVLSSQAGGPPSPMGTAPMGATVQSKKDDESTKPSLHQSVATVDGRLDDSETSDYNPIAFLAPAESTDEIGRLGGYRVLKVLGRGGMGIVFQAEDIALQRKIALKTMLPAFAENAGAKKRFLREAQMAANIEHDHIITIHQVGEDRGVPFLAMPLLRGQSLEDELKSRRATGAGPLPVNMAVRIAREIAEGLAAAHERGMIHRDIKPANIWLEGEKKKVKILDFGLARTGSDTAQLTQTGAILGTPAYMAPEQARAMKVDGRADLFSLGAVLYEMLTGRRAFKGHDAMSILASLAIDVPTAPSEVNGHVPVAVSTITMKLLEKNADGRYATARDVAQALQDIEGRLTTSTTANTKKVGTKKVRTALAATPPRSKVVWLVAGIGLLVLVPLVWLGVSYLLRDPPGNRESHGLNVPTPPESKKETVATRPTTPREQPQVFDLIEMYSDGARVAVQDRTGKNSWIRPNGQTLIYDSDGKAGKVMFPVALNYVTHFTLEGTVRRVGRGNESFTWDIVSFDPANPGASKQTGIDFRIGSRIDLTLSDYLRKQIGGWPAGVVEPSHVVMEVKRGQSSDEIRIRINNIDAAYWKGTLSTFGKPAKFHNEYPGQCLPSIFVNRDSFEFSDLTLKVYEGEAKRLDGK